MTEENPYEVIDFMEKHGLVPFALGRQIYSSELKIPVRGERTNDCYYLHVQDHIVVAVYRKSDISWKHA